MALILAVAIGWLLVTVISVGPASSVFPASLSGLLVAIPICIGFLVGPWLDLHSGSGRSDTVNASAAAYWAGSTQFFVLLLSTVLTLGRSIGARVPIGRTQTTHGHECS
jgi:hypothetical protein